MLIAKNILLLQYLRNGQERPQVFLITISLFNNTYFHFCFALFPVTLCAAGGEGRSEIKFLFVIFLSNIPGYMCIFIASFCGLHACTSLTRKIPASEDSYCP